MRVWKRMSFDVNFDFNFSSISFMKVGRNFSRFWPGLVVCVFSLIVVFPTKPDLPTNRCSSWQVDGVRNDKILSP